MKNNSITQITLKSNEELIKRTKQHTTKNFYMLGRETLVNKADKGQKADWQFEGIDFIDTMVNLSSKEQRVVKLIKDCIKWDKAINSYNYIAHLPPDSVEFDPAADDSMAFNTFQKAFGTMFKKDLIRRVSRHHYMFNPEFFLITGEQASYFIGKWNESKRYEGA